MVICNLECSIRFDPAPVFGESTLLLTRRFRDRFHLRQPFVEFAAHYLFHVHDQAERLADKILPAGNAPGPESVEGLLSRRA